MCILENSASRHPPVHQTEVPLRGDGRCRQNQYRVAIRFLPLMTESPTQAIASRSIGARSRPSAGQKPSWRNRLFIQIEKIMMEDTTEPATKIRELSDDFACPAAHTA